MSRPTKATRSARLSWSGCLPDRAFPARERRFIATWNRLSALALTSCSLPVRRAISGADGFLKCRFALPGGAKLKTLTSVYQAEELERIRDIAGRPKNRNEGIFYTIDSLHFAIQHKRKVHFSYYRHVIRDGRITPQKSHEFTVSPYALIWNDGKYYLVANYGKYDNFSHYRLDRMRQVEVLLEPSRPLNEFSRYDEELDETDYISGVFGMYAGKEEDYVYLRCSGDCLEHLIDRFGHKLLCEVNGDESFTVRVKALINDGLVSWILAQRGGVQAMYPPELSDRVRQTLAAMLEAL